MIASLVFMLLTLGARDSTPHNVIGADSIAMLVAPDPCKLSARGAEAGELRITPGHGWQLQPPYQVSIVFNLSTEPGIPVVGSTPTTFVPDASSKDLRFQFNFPSFDVAKEEQLGLLVRLDAGTPKGPHTAFTQYSFGPCIVEP